MRYRPFILAILFFSAISLLVFSSSFLKDRTEEDKDPIKQHDSTTPPINSNPVNRTFQLEQYNVSHIHNKEWIRMLKNESTVLRTCHFEKHVVRWYLAVKQLNFTHSGSCTPNHTLFNERSSTIRMKCQNSTHIPFVYLTEKKVLNSSKYTPISQNVERWMPFPKEYYDTNREYEVNSSMDVIHTACVDVVNGTSYHSFFVRSIRNETLVQSKKEQMVQYLHQREEKESVPTIEDMKRKLLSDRPLDIHVILVDSTSRDFFDRQFVHSKQALGQLSKTYADTIDIIQFSEYQIVGYNTAINMYQFSTGLPVVPGHNYREATTKRLKGHPMTVPFLWDHLKEMGYVSCVGGDMGEAPYTVGALYGYKGQVLTYDLYPSFYKVASYVQETLKKNYAFRSLVCPCVGSRFMSDVTFEFARSMFQAYHDTPKFLMTLHNEAHTPMSTQVMMIDRDLSVYLTHLGESGKLNHTAVMILADHGMHYGPHYNGQNKKQAIFEHGRPLATLILPKYVTSDELRSNANRTVNIRDFHMTLRDIASFPIRSSPKGTPVAQSLLHDLIPSNRTCEQMRVDPKYRDACAQ